MMKFLIEYYDAGDRLRTREVEAPDLAAAITLLVNDDQHPLAQFVSGEVVEEDEPNERT